MNTSFTKGEQNFHHIINKYTKLDPTLPRVYNIPCPNKECKKTNQKTTRTLQKLFICVMTMQI